VRYEKFYTRSDRDDSIYQYIPFEVPTGCDGLTITMHYDDSLSTVDLGLFDPTGFRGWSGGERDLIQISHDEATPGYLPGDIPAGTWFVALGLHQVGRDGVGVEVTVEHGRPKFPVAEQIPPSENRPPRRILQAPAGFRWMSADFHSHSTHSDGRLSLDQLANLATSRGLEILAITDHNTISHHAHLPTVAKRAGINLLAGHEVTTASGHANAFGKIEWTDFREASSRWLEDVSKRGGLLSINHPLATPCHWDRDYPEGVPLMEMWHSSWDRFDLSPLEYWREKGSPIPIGGSDFHRLGSDGLPGDPTTWVMVETEDDLVSEQQVMDALRNGRVAISAGPGAPVVYPMGDDLIVQDGEGAVLLTPSGAKKLVDSQLFYVKAEQGLYTLTSHSGEHLAVGYIR
jgi:hypothetical protein